MRRCCPPAPLTVLAVLLTVVLLPWSSVVGTASAASAASAASSASDSSASPAAEPTTLRVATYNIRYGAGGDGEFDLDRTAAAIAELDADVIGLQEVDVHWSDRSNHLDVAQQLADRLDMDVRFAPIYDFAPSEPGAPRRQFGVAVLSRFPIVAFTNHDLTRLSTQDPNPVPRPMPGFAEAVVEVAGTQVHVYSTHLDYRGDPYVRVRQVADTVRILRAHPIGTPQVLTGDLNALADAPELQPLWAPRGPLTNVVSFDDSPTYPAAEPRTRIDHVAVTRQLEVIGARVPDTELARTASDHRPVVATLELKET